MVFANLFLYFLGFIFLNHFAACFLFYVGRIQYESYPYARFDNRTWFTEFGSLPFNAHFEKIWALPADEQYIHCLYWAFACIGTVAYGDIIPVTVAEKTYGIIAMIIAKVFTAFIYAEAANVVSSFHSSSTEHVLKKKSVQMWMTHKSLPSDIQHRVLYYYDLLWQKFRGIDDT